MADEPSDDPRDAVLAVGLQRLLTHGMEGLRSIVNASALARDAPVSRDTAYRVFRRDGSRHIGVVDCRSSAARHRLRPRAG